MKRQNNKKTPVFITVITIFIALILVVSAIILFARQLERQKFLGLDGRMEKLSQELNAVDPSLKWTYERGCNAYGTFGERANCKVNSYTRDNISSVAKFEEIYNKYHKFFSSNSMLTQAQPAFRDPDLPRTELENTTLNSSFKDKTSSLKCNFFGVLESDQTKHDIAGTAIAVSPAEMKMTFTCEEHTAGFWYPRVDSITSPSPSLF